MDCESVSGVAEARLRPKDVVTRFITEVIRSMAVIW